MSNELEYAVGALRSFIQRANLQWPDMPMVTLTFATQEHRDRFRTQVLADMTPHQKKIFTEDKRSLGLGIDAEIDGIKIALRVKQ